MDQKEADNYIREISGCRPSFPFGKHLAVYEVEEIAFAIIEDKKQPLRISLRCEPRLSRLLREKYDEVMTGYKLNKNKWITVVVSGQLNQDELKDLIRHSYQLAGGKLS